MKTAEKSIRELARPLSATVMPATALHNVGGRKMSEAHALSSQRHRDHKIIRKKKGKDDGNT